MKKTFYILWGFVVFAIWPLAAEAGEPRLLSTHGAWDAYVFYEEGNKVCYMASRPKKEEGNYSKRGDIYALITHRPEEGSKNVFSYITGYDYKQGSDATLEIGSDRFVLFTQDDTAWAPGGEGDARIAKAIRAGSKMVLSGTSARGTQTKDTFDLTGSSDAHERISKECGVR